MLQRVYFLGSALLGSGLLRSFLLGSRLGSMLGLLLMLGYKLLELLLGSKLLGDAHCWESKLGRC